MDLLEHEGKQILKRYGVRVPEGQLAQNPLQAAAAAARLGKPCMVKAQVRKGGRGKAGLVKAVEDSQGAARLAAELFGVRSAVEVDVLLVEQRLDIARELYLAVRLDDVSGSPVVLASLAGGVDIEQNPGSLASHQVDVLEGLVLYEAVALWKKAGLAGPLVMPAAMLTLKVWQAFWESDAELIEINPVAVDQAGQLWAADAKVSIDDNALFRHDELQAMLAEPGGTVLEKRARKLGVNTYIDLADRGIATISSGASFSMLLLDQITAAGGQPANFIDMGGGSTPLARQKIMEVVMRKSESEAGIAAILIAFVLTSKPLQITIDALRGAFAARRSSCPAFAWISAGQVATENLSIDDARAQLEAVGIHTFATLGEAIRAAVAVSKQ